MANSGKSAKNKTRQLMAHHLCRIQEPLDLRIDATPCIQQRQTPLTLTIGRAPAMHPRKRSGQALTLTKTRTASTTWDVCCFLCKLK
jgi:hypothetical protein